MTLLRAMSPQYTSDEAILNTFYEAENIDSADSKAAAKLEGRIACGDVVDPTTGEVLVESGATISKALAQVLADAGNLGPISVLKDARDQLILQSLQDDPTSDHESALLRIYQRLRPGNPPQLEKARELFHEKFFDTNRYRLGKVGRFRINRKFNQTVPEDRMTLDPQDYVNAIRYILRLRRGNDAKVHIDDIDHLGNRRLRTIDELAADELRKGFLKLRRTVQERMSLKEADDMTPRSLINPKSISAAIEYFFGRGELSQVVDQTNPLAQLTHERRLSALGPGGLNRKRAGFEVRDVHISHYGRICPIETPEGTNIGLISSLGIYGGVDEYGFLITPYRKIKHGKKSEEVVWMRADEESEAYLAPADAVMDDHGKLKGPIPDRALPDRLRHGRRRSDRVYGHLSQADGRRLGRVDPVPRARRRQPCAHGFEHAAPGGAALGGRAADRRHRPGAVRGRQFRHGRQGAAGWNDHLCRFDPGDHRP